MKPIIQGLWIGESLSVMEICSLKSFLAHDHDYHLYCYDTVQNVPAGVTVCDANAILPREKIFKYTGYDSYAGFANYFRYALLYQKGNYWADTDFICLRTFDFVQEYVFAGQNNEQGPSMATNSLIKAPVGSAFMKRAMEICVAKDPTKLRWGETGPSLVHDLIKEFGYQAFIAPPHVFCPINYWEWEAFLSNDPLVQIQTRESLSKEVYAVHLWHEMWRRAGKNKRESFPSSCLYEEFKAQYG